MVVLEREREREVVRRRVPGSEGRRGPPVKPRPHPLPSCRYLDEEGGAPWINPRLVHAMAAAAAAAAAAANTGEAQFIQTPRQPVALVPTRGGGGERSSIMPTTTTSSTPQQHRGTVPVLTVLDPAPFSAHRDMELPNRTHRHHHHHHHHQRNQQAVYAEPFLQMQAAAAAAASSSAAAAFFAR
ncbi:hypothetical protein B566_EDAN014165 [Ephemera danica]|nr:hypothetical protein B566_EDAN014165 [Ephemera danica]